MRERNRSGSVSFQKRDLDGLAEELGKEFGLPPEICRALVEKFTLHHEKFMAPAREPGQILFAAASAGVHGGVKKSKISRVPVMLTLYDPSDSCAATHQDLLRSRVLRLAREAQNQRALLTQGELAILLGVSLRTLQRHIKILENKGETVIFRGTLLKLGPRKRGV